ncbi:hypothetical protein BY458DRAFT_534100 [Sporodiniella umbellata]|nr:hypothetical protein BY458DRAFT_534100 [Sporodiniella umbellata]
MLKTTSLTPEQEETKRHIFFSSGSKGALVGLAVGAMATVLSLRRSPEFRALSRPVQSMMVVGGSTAGFLFASDSAVSRYENYHLGYADEETLQTLLSKNQSMPTSSFDRSLNYLNENRWSFIGFSWAASMIGALGYSFTNKYLTTQQKIVQARMSAQAVTIAVLMISAGISVYVGDQNKSVKEAPDSQLQAVLELPEDLSSS